MEHALAKDADAKMHKSLESFQHELVGIRTGRASVGLFDTVDVEAYGDKMKINQLGTITAPEARLLVITPWDKSVMSAIEKAILASDLGLTPSNDGQVIRVNLPQLTEERRKELVKYVSKLAEEARVSIRNIRRHVVDHIKKDQKDGVMPEDDAHKLSAEIQRITDLYVAKVDETLKHKEDEIMEV
ncbi:MAG: ribosome-recycling factor [Candidatus Hydrogenedentota bacterium]